MRIALCCRDGLFCEALASLLDQRGLRVVAKENDLRALLSATKSRRAQVMLVDSVGLGADDLHFLLGARAFGDFAVALLVPEGDRAHFASEAVDCLITRSEGADKLVSSLRELASGVGASRAVVREPRRAYSPPESRELSPREMECARLVSQGMSNRKIAQVTGLREQSVKNLVSVIMRKLRCENRVQVALQLTKGRAPAAAAAAYDGE